MNLPFFLCKNLWPPEIQWWDSSCCSPVEGSPLRLCIDYGNRPRPAQTLHGRDNICVSERHLGKKVRVEEAHSKSFCDLVLKSSEQGGERLRYRAESDCISWSSQKRFTHTNGTPQSGTYRGEGWEGATISKGFSEIFINLQSYSKTDCPLDCKADLCSLFC